MKRNLQYGMNFDLCCALLLFKDELQMLKNEQKSQIMMIINIKGKPQACSHGIK